MYYFIKHESLFSVIRLFLRVPLIGTCIKVKICMKSNKFNIEGIFW